MYKLGLVGIYEIGFLKADFDHEPSFNTLIIVPCVAHLYYTITIRLHEWRMVNRQIRTSLKFTIHD